jgi:predicted small secreted protein
VKRLVACVVLAGPLVLAACSANTAGRAGRPADVLEIAKAREPKVTWKGKGVLEADIDCDGTEDYVLEGRKGKDVLVMVVLGPATKSSKTAVQELPVEELCGEPVALTLESLDYDPEAGGVPGFKRSRKCKGLNLGSGECDAVHLFWNHETASLDTWRL